MQENCTIEERWNSVNSIVERWLGNRQALIVQYCAVTGIHKRNNPAEQIQNRLSRFCELLVDYVSAGHFEVYYELVREAEEFDDGSSELAKSTLPRLNESTQDALDFNDLYAAIDEHTSLDSLHRHLSKLGEVLETRFALEDELIEVMHTSHKAQVSSG